MARLLGPLGEGSGVDPGGTQSARMTLRSPTTDVEDGVGDGVAGKGVGVAVGLGVQVGVGVGVDVETGAGVGLGDGVVVALGVGVAQSTRIERSPTLFVEEGAGV